MLFSNKMVKDKNGWVSPTHAVLDEIVVPGPEPFVSVHINRLLKLIEDNNPPKVTKVIAQLAILHTSHACHLTGREMFCRRLSTLIAKAKCCERPVC